MLAIYGPGSARDHACAERILRERGEGGLRLYHCGSNAMLARAPWSTTCPPRDPALAARRASEDRAAVVLITDAALLIDGVADAFAAEGLRVLAPSSAEGAIEGHKAFMKDLLFSSGVPTPESWNFAEIGAAVDFLKRNWSDDTRFVVKMEDFVTDGHLRSMVPKDLAEALVDVAAEFEADAALLDRHGIIVERRVYGFETSLHVLWDGDSYVLFPPVRDYKPARDGDTGPNTNGAAALACGAGFDPVLERRLRTEIVEPMLEGLARAGRAYRGFLYFGIMLTDDGPVCLELNVRPGNPEFVALLGLLASDFGDLVEQAAAGRLHAARPRWHTDAYCGAVFAMAEGYPESEEVAPVPVEGLEESDWRGHVVVEGVAEDVAGRLVVGDGRVAAAVATAPSVEAVRASVYADLEKIRFAGKHWRGDLGSGLADGLFART